MTQLSIAPLSLELLEIDRNVCPGLDSHFQMVHIQLVYYLILILLGRPASGEKMFSVTIQGKHWLF